MSEARRLRYSPTPSKDRSRAERLQAQDVLLVGDPQGSNQAVVLVIDPPADSMALDILDPAQDATISAGWTGKLSGPGQAGQLQLEVLWTGETAPDPDPGRWPGQLVIELSLRECATFLHQAAQGIPLGLLAASPEQVPYTIEMMQRIIILPPVPLGFLSLMLAHEAADLLGPPEWHALPDQAGSLVNKQWAGVRSLRRCEQLMGRAMQYRLPPSAQPDWRNPDQGMDPGRRALLAQGIIAASKAREKLPEAQPVLVEGQLLAAAPDWEDLEQQRQFALRCRLLLPLLWLDFADEQGRPAVVRMGDDEASAPLALASAVVWQEDEPQAGESEVHRQLHMILFGSVSDQGPDCDPALYLSFTSSPARSGVNVCEQELRVWNPPGYPEQESHSLQQILSVRSQALGGLVLSALLLCQAKRISAEEVPLSAKQRKMMVRRQQSPARILTIAPSSTPPAHAESEPAASGRKVGVRFWSRGHMAFYPVGTRVADADPEQLTWLPERGWGRLVWRSPSLKGPADAPIVRRVRRYQ